MFLRNKRREFRHRIFRIVSFDSLFLRMHSGGISAGLGSLFRSGGQSPSKEDGSAVGRWVHAGENWSMVSLSTLHSGSMADEFLHRRPERNFCRVSRVCANNNIRVVEVLMWELERAWDSAINFINKHHSRLTLGIGQYLVSHLEFGFVPYSTHPLYRNH